MRKEDKSTIIEQIAATVKEYGHFYLVDTSFKIDIQDDCLHLNREEVSIQENKVCNDVVSPKLQEIGRAHV